MAATKIYLEVGPKRVFACSFEWPGWCRSGKDRDAAIEALRSYQPRYAKVANLADIDLEAGEVEVIEEVVGNATPDFGAPAIVTKWDRESYFRPTSPTPGVLARCRMEVPKEGSR